LRRIRHARVVVRTIILNAMNRKEKFVVSLNRELGTGGRTVGRKLAERLAVKYYDKAVIDGLTKEFGLTPEFIEELKGKKMSWWGQFCSYYNSAVTSSIPMEMEPLLTAESMMETEIRILQELASQESCVVAGRSGFFVFRSWPNHLSVFIRASMESRIARLMEKRNMDREEAIRTIEKVDKARENFTRKYADASRYDTHNYDLVVNMDGLTEDDAADIIMAYIERLTANAEKKRS